MLFRPMWLANGVLTKSANFLEGGQDYCLSIFVTFGPLRILGNSGPRLNEEPFGMLATSPTTGRLIRRPHRRDSSIVITLLQVHSAGFRAHLTLTLNLPPELRQTVKTLCTTAWF